MATDFSILAWRIPRTEKFCGITESDMTEQHTHVCACTHTHTHTHTHFHIHKGAQKRFARALSKTQTKASSHFVLK